jgi:hypothetical protein
MSKTVNVYTLSVIYILILFLFPKAGNAQLPCTISIDRAMPVCNGEVVGLSVQAQSGLRYRWTPTGDTTPVIHVKINQATDFQVSVTDPSNGNSCLSTPFHVSVLPKINVQFTQLQLTCTNADQDNGNTAQVRATASGAFDPSDYQYFWEVKPIQLAPGDPSVAVGLKAHQYYAIRVEDPNGCSVRDTFYTKAYANPKVKILADPDTAYIQNPHIKFSFENLSDTIQIANNYWEFDQDANTYSQTELNYTFTEIGNYQVYLKVYNQQGCDTLYTESVQIFPVQLFIPNVFTPNGDGINDHFVITDGGGSANQNGTLKSLSATTNYKPLNTYYESTHLVIFNRFGRIVYETDDYKNNWDGGGLPDGTYYYVLKCSGFKDKKVVYKGSVSIFASHTK